MPDNGIDWEARFGKAADKMDEGEWRMAVAVMLSEACGKAKLVSGLQTSIKVIFAVGGIILAAISILFTMHFGG